MQQTLRNSIQQYTSSTFRHIFQPNALSITLGRLGRALGSANATAFSLLSAVEFGASRGFSDALPWLRMLTGLKIV